MDCYQRQRLPTVCVLGLRGKGCQELYEYNNPRLFCYHCGRPMTDEAVQLFLKRIEAMRGGEDMP